jgi:putative transposase
VLKAFRYRISPTSEQEILINKHIGSARFVYNLALETKSAAWAGNRVTLNCFDLIKQLPDLKEECTWLKEINSQSLQQPIRNLDNAFTRFFKGHGNFPKFKKKSNGGSFNIPQNVTLEGEKLIIPKFKKGIGIVLHRPIKGAIRQATISRTPTGKYFVSILCETGEAIKAKAKIKEDTTIGIDLGIKTYIVASDGKEFDNPKFLRKAQSRLKFVQRKLSKARNKKSLTSLKEKDFLKRKYSKREPELITPSRVFTFTNVNGSPDFCLKSELAPNTDNANILKIGKRTKHRLAILHEKVANQRKDFLHKTSTQLIRENQSVAIEDLAVSNMVRNHKLAQSVSDAGWSMFVTMLEYKAEWYGKNILKIGRFEPSSKLHNTCGHINKDLTLSDREWICPKCGEVVLRDMNAAVNIKSFALKNHLSVERRLKNHGQLPTLVGAFTHEAHPIGSAVGG